MNNICCPLSITSILVHNHNQHYHPLRLAQVTIPLTKGTCTLRLEQEANNRRLFPSLGFNLVGCLLSKDNP